MEWDMHERYSDQNNSYEIIINGFQVRKIKNKKCNFQSPLWESFVSVKAEVHSVIPPQTFGEEWKFWI